MTEIASLLQRFWHLRRIMLLAVLIGGVAATLSLFRITGESPYLKSRSTVRGVADINVLVDSERSALANADADVETLATRSHIFVQLVDAANVRRLIAREAGIDPARLAIVTFDQRAGAAPARNPTLGERGGEIADEVLGYRLEVAAQERVPIISMSAQAPDAEGAARLADAAAHALVQYVSALTGGPAEASLDAGGAAATSGGRRTELGRIRLEPLGAARGREVSAGGGYARGVIFGGFGFVVTAVVILFIAGLRDELRARRAAAPRAFRAG
ncbi:MAG TPA: hypothetical protein VMY78_15225 [Solirubrobacteraceae bacterium]|nr:hypothetical protein [Solirubrobacteraceae bacterium]